jgi:hypothetical protein
MSVTRDGFLRQEYPKRISLGRGQQIGDIVFRLNPASTVTGWVLDEYAEPIPNVLVEALRRSYDVRGYRTFIRAASALTDDRGEYRIFWLDPGEYFFYATSPPRENPEAPARAVPPTYFPGVSNPSDAKPIRLDIGREVHGADFRLRHVAMEGVRGYVWNVVAKLPVAASVTLTRPAEDPSFSRYRAQSVATGPNAGGFSFSEPVAPGSYIVTAKGASGDNIAGFERLFIPPAAASRPYPYDVRVGLSPPLALGGRLYVDSGALLDLGAAKISLVSLDAAFPSPPRIAAQANGQFLVKDVLRGTYLVDVSNLPSDFYLKAARYGTADALEEPLTIEKDAGLALQILLGSDGGRVIVAVLDSRNQLHESATVVLVPDSARRHRPDQYRLAVSGENGQASFRGIPPGNYRVFAWESIEPNAHLNADYIRGYEDLGIAMRILPGENRSISVRLIRKE